MDTKGLQKYIKECRDLKMSDESILKKLTASGWPADIVSQALNPPLATVSTDPHIEVKPRDVIDSVAPSTVAPIIQPEVIASTPQSPQPSIIPESAVKSEIPNNKVVYAGFGRRLGAFFIDVSIYAMTIWLFTVVMSFLGIATNILTVIYIIFEIVLYVFLPIILIYTRGGTFGKLLLGIKIKKDNGEKIGLIRVIFRETVGKIISAIPLGFGFIWIAISDKKQGFHDKIFKTMVTYDEAEANKNKKKMKAVVIITSVFLFIIIGFGIFELAQIAVDIPKINTTLSGFLKDASVKDYSLAYQYTSTEMRQKSTEKTFEKQMDSMQALLTGFDKLSFTSFKTQNGRIIYLGKITYSDGGSGELTALIKKENNEWKVSGVYIISSVNRLKR